ncbi:asparagine synthase-related protein [Roseiarcaceae bacterium H3SJ34-1]|uniref:asparagine synthetase B family protein n=1 Tax=Terripilifer ovatus TaxID=3032367 RepID=UPI003AB97456|nr:asparagine synthase-related protein [Roseiarcaceae bacterium H3SJ34-1]
MSAIAGVVFADGRDVAQQLPDRMAAAAARRGDDGVAIWRDGPAALIRFRHATTPEALGERQPCPSSSGAVICFDGRLDNRQELLALLGLEAAFLKHAPDCDLVLALVERVGEDCLSQFVGDYAFAIWQPRSRRLFCARSPMGWRPFLWTFDGTRFGFATEPRTLVAGLGLERRLNEGFIGELLSTRIVSPTETFWQDIHRLEQGCCLTLQHGKVQTRRWHTEQYEDFSDLSRADHVERFNELFDQALISLTRSSTPVVAHLSGGLDSSAVVCRATELFRSGRIGQQIAAVSVRYPGEPQDETRWSGAVERHLGIEARIAGDLPFDMDAARDWCASTLQLPVRPNTLGPTLSVCAAMRTRGERVLLTGEGGDDWLNGSHAHWPDLLRRGRFGRLLHEGLSCWPGRSRLGSLRGILSESLGPMLSSHRRRRLVQPHLRLDDPIPAWVRPDWARRIELAERWRAPPPVHLPNFAQQQRYSALSSAYREVIFDPIKACAERLGIELRHPFNDLRLVRFLIGARGDMLLHGVERKHILREALRGTLPEEVRTRRTKAYFSAPIIDALTLSFSRCVPEKMQVVQRGWVDPVAMTRLFEENRQWRAHGLSGNAPNTALAGLWFAVAMEMWLENALTDATQ